MYFVVRVYSSTDKRLLWKVESRPIKNKADAEFELEYHQSLDTKNEFFIVKGVK